MIAPAVDGQAVLRVESLRLELGTGDSVVEDISLELRRGEILGLVGESGSGKTTAALALLGYARPGIRLAGGRISIDGREVTSLRETQLRRLRGRVMSYIPQEREETDVLFLLLAERYERRSLLVSSNLVFSKWDQIFKDPMTTMAAIDRLVHHAIILEFNGNSHRAKAAKETAGK